MRFLIPSVIALAAPFAGVGCVQEQISTGDPAPAPEPTAQTEQAAQPTPAVEQVEQAAQAPPVAEEVEQVEQVEQAAATLPAFDLRAKADGDANILFAVAAPEAEGKSAGFFALEEIGASDGAALRPIQSALDAGIEFPIALNDSQGAPLSDPRALVAVRDSEQEQIQRVFIFCASAEGYSSVAEIVYDPSPAESGKPLIEVGRVFNVPVQGPIQGRIDLRPSADRTQLFVNLDAPAGDSKQPMVLLYDIVADSKSLEPAEVRMVPKM